MAESFNDSAGLRASKSKQSLITRTQLWTLSSQDQPKLFCYVASSGLWECAARILLERRKGHRALSRTIYNAFCESLKKALSLCPIVESRVIAELAVWLCAFVDGLENYIPTVVHKLLILISVQNLLSTLFSNCTVFPGSIRPPCTTMPWTIWSALAVLWGVC